MRTTTRVLLLLCLAATAFLIGACGSSSSAGVGDCIDASNKVVDCSSPDAKQKLATACIVIDTPKEVEVSVNGHKFCGQPLK
jgi:hypothetical protein